MKTNKEPEFPQNFRIYTTMNPLTGYYKEVMTWENQ
jgi:hypothetical protein